MHQAHVATGLDIAGQHQAAFALVDGQDGPDQADVAVVLAQHCKREQQARARQVLGVVAKVAAVDLERRFAIEFVEQVAAGAGDLAHRTKGLAWSSARFLAIALLDYWAWREKRTKPASQFGLNETRLDHYLAQSGRSFLGLGSVRVLSTLQAFHYFTEYLVAHDYFSAAEAAPLQSAAAGFYEIIRSAADPCDSAYRICPTYEALISAPPATSHRAVPISES